MVLSLVFLVLVFAIAFRQATFGLFSALIMAVLTICCTAAAIGWHEWLAAKFLAPYWKPDFSYPLALAATFAVPLIVLRLLFDQTITRACLIPVWLDRAGGAACGLVTGLATAGVLALAIQMVPFGRSILGYSPVTSFATEAGSPGPTVSADRRPGLLSREGDFGDQKNSFWLGPDRFAAVLTSMVSTGIFGDQNSFYRDNPDFAGWIGRVNAVPTEVSRFARPDSISVTATTAVDYVYRLKPAEARRNEPPVYEPIDPPPGRTFRVVQLKLGEGARDARKSLVFTLRQFRMVGVQPELGQVTELYPIALQQEDASQPVNRHIYSFVEGSGERPLLDDVFSPRGGDTIEVAFAVPAGFQPQFVEYKRGARAAVSFTAGDRSRTTEAGGATPPPPASPPEAPAEPARPGPRTRRVSAKPTNSFFGEQLPMTLKSYQRRANVDIQGTALTNGHVVGRVAAQEGGSDAELTQFAVPQDRRLLHLNTNFLRARSGLGRAISFAIGTVQNYQVRDANGNTYTLAGKYAIANVEGNEVIEVQYFPDQAGMMGSGQPFADIKEQHLTGDYTLVLLFLVEPGAKMVSFSSGSPAAAADDLTSQNLTAPQ